MGPCGRTSFSERMAHLGRGRTGAAVQQPALRRGWPGRPSEPAGAAPNGQRAESTITGASAVSTPRAAMPS